MVLGIVALFICTVITPSVAVNTVKKPIMPVSNGNILYVGGSGGGNYTTIQDAIDDAVDGDTVYVYDDNSPYYENLIVDKSINLVGEDRDTTIIDGDGIDSVIEVYADHVYIERFTVTNCPKNLTEAGINISTEWNTIKNNNIVENQGPGIRLYSSHYNLIENNTLKNNVGHHIILNEESNNNNIQNNTLTASDNWPYCCKGISLYQSSNNLIINNEITRLKFTVGIGLKTSSYNVVNKNRIHNNLCDDVVNNIQITRHSDFNLILDNEIKSNNGSGIVMLFSQGNEIIRNIIEFHPLWGIYLLDCRYDNIVRFNNISYTKTGIKLGVYSSKNIIELNNLTSNIYGIYLSGTNLLGFVPNNVIYGNNIVENNYGIYITIHNLYSYSNDSLICHNNFINNTQNAFDECNNIWDDGKNGNYWDDYNGEDKDGNGIGDTPYPVPGGYNEDRYPLMDPWYNTPPNAPIIDGPSSGKPNTEYDFTFNSTDYDGDDIAEYIIDWGDDTGEITISGPFASGEEITGSHSWTSQETFTIKAKAKDINGAKSNWSEFAVTIPRAKSFNTYNNLLSWLFERFPLLEILLSLIRVI